MIPFAHTRYPFNSQSISFVGFDKKEEPSRGRRLLKTHVADLGQNYLANKSAAKLSK